MKFKAGWRICPGADSSSGRSLTANADTAQSRLCTVFVEFQIRKIDKELSSLLQQYFNEGFNKNIADNAELFLRVIPVQKYIDIEHHIASYNDVEVISREC